MSNQQILEKAIQKAIDSRWLPNKETNGKFHVSEWQTKNGLPRINNPSNKFAVYFDESKGGVAFGQIYSVNDIIFNHDFAKSFFGTKEVCFNCGLGGKHDPYCAERTSYDEAWKYHLREMVIYDNPIEYLGEQL